MECAARRARGVLVVVCALLGAGCLEPLQNGGVTVVGDPYERIAAMCRFRHSDAASEVCGGSGLEEDLDVAGAPGARAQGAPAR